MLGLKERLRKLMSHVEPVEPTTFALRVRVSIETFKIQAGLANHVLNEPPDT